MCFDWSINYGDYFFRRELVKFILAILKKNISTAKVKTNGNAHAQMNFAAKSPFVLPNGKPP